MPKATQKTKGRPKKTLADKRDRRPQKIAKAAHKAGDESSDEGEIPPEVRVNLPSLKDIRAALKDPKDVNLPVDILLLTAKNYEFIACYMQLKNPFKCWFDDVGYVYFGEVGDGDGEKLKVTLLRCHRGSVGPGSSLITVKNAVSVLGPKAVISVGTCSGLNPETTKLGDVIVSAKLTTYASKIVASRGEQSTGMRSYVSRNFLNLIKCADHGWKAPLKNPEALDINVHCDGEFLSGPELISAEWRRDELAKSYPLATAIEMEGEGIFAAAFDDQIDWLVVKGIADFADSTDCTSENWRPFASVMAASVVANILSDPVVFRGWPHKGGKRKSSSESLDQDKKRTKLEGLPEKPTITNTESEVDSDFTLTWSEVEANSSNGSIKYRLEWRKQPMIGSTQLVQRRNIVETQYKIIGLEYGAEYEMKLFSVNRQGESEPDVRTFKTKSETHHHKCRK